MEGRPQNFALTNGSQNSFFICSTSLPAGSEKPGASKSFSPRPRVHRLFGGRTGKGLLSGQPARNYRLDNNLFKYQVDFDSLKINEQTGAVCFSRPTNPTGNVVTDEEVERLREGAKRQGVPLIIDNAYGTPFPNIIYEDVQPVWDEDVIVCMSLSKLGLPGLRTGIVIAREETIRIVSKMTSVFSLAPGGMGPALALDLVMNGEITQISREVVRPFYEAKAQRAVAQLQRELEGLPFAIHKPEGALFLWLWFEGLPISTRELYERLKKKGVLVVSGHYFFPGLEENWPHKNECIRVTYAQDDEVVEKGLSLIASEIREIHSRS